MSTLNGNGSDAFGAWIRTTVKPAIAAWADRTQQTQAHLASLCGMDRAELTHLLNDGRIIAHAKLALLAEQLNLDVIDVLLRAGVGRCDRELSDAKESLSEVAQIGWRSARRAYAEALETVTKAKAPSPRQRFDFLSLADWPWAFDPMIVLVGDRREDAPPHSVADLLAFSASTGDLFYFSDLGLPRGTTIRSDKTTKLVSVESLRTKFDRNLLIVGSPAANLAARLVNPGACFSFLVADTDLNEEAALERRLAENPYDRDFLAAHLDQESPDAASATWAYKRKHLLYRFARAGLVDPVNFKFPRAENRKSSVDFGLVTLCKHPWSDSRVAVLAAGIGGPGTAAALKLLGTQGAFDSHPLGGVFHVNVAQEAPWEDRYQYLKPNWATEAYDLPKYEADLAALNLEQRSLQIGWNKERVWELLALLKRSGSQNKRWNKF